VRVAWSSLPAGIVIGFGVFAGFDLLLLILHSRWGKDYPFLFHVLRGMAANLQSLIWIVWVKWLAVPAESGMQLLFTTDPLVLQWEKGLAHFHGRQSSYISDLQSVVDRVMQEHDRSRND